MPPRLDVAIKFIREQATLLTLDQMRSVGQIAHMAVTNAYADATAEQAEAAHKRVIFTNDSGETRVYVELTALAEICPAAIQQIYGIVLARHEEMDRPR